jgi:hypothetical protein
MSNIEEKSSNRLMFRVRMKGAPPPNGWFVRYVSGMEDKNVKPGEWLTQYSVDREGYINFNFEPEMDLHWKSEAEATAVSNALKQSANVETAVVKIGQ